MSGLTSLYAVRGLRCKLPQALLPSVEATIHRSASQATESDSARDREEDLKLHKAKEISEAVDLVINFEIESAYPEKLPEKGTPDEDNWTIKLANAEACCAGMQAGTSAESHSTEETQVGNPLFKVCPGDVPPVHPVFDSSDESKSQQGSQSSPDHTLGFVPGLVTATRNCDGIMELCELKDRKGPRFPLKLVYADSLLEAGQDQTARTVLSLNLPSIVNQIDFVVQHIGVTNLKAYGKALCALLRSQACPAGYKPSDQTHIRLEIAIVLKAGNNLENDCQVIDHYRVDTRSLEGERECKDYFAYHQEFNLWGMVDVLFEADEAEGEQSFGLYRLRIAPGHKIPLHGHAVMCEAEMLVEGERVAVYAGSQDMQQLPQSSKLNPNDWVYSVSHDSAMPVLGSAFQWSNRAHGYANLSGDQWAAILCIDRPKFVPGDEIRLPYSQVGTECSVSPHESSHSSSCGRECIVTPGQPHLHHCGRCSPISGTSCTQTLSTGFRPGEYIWRSASSRLESLQFPGTYPGQIVHVSFAPHHEKQPDAVLILSALRSTVLNQKSPYLTLVQHHRRGWEVPGGKVETAAGETAIQAAVREWTEETGLSVQVSEARETTAGQTTIELEGEPLHLLRYTIQEGQNEHAKDVLLFPLITNSTDAQILTGSKLHHETKNIGLYSLQWLSFSHILHHSHLNSHLISPLLLDNAFAAALHVAQAKSR